MSEFGNEEQLLFRLQQEFVLDWHGLHGGYHWARVLANGMKLAESTGADVRVVRLFAMFHDCGRFGEGSDPRHGLRGAIRAEELLGRHLELKRPLLDLLTEACRLHTSAASHDDITVRTCFDADRLDLGRVGIRPDPRHLCTDAARDGEMIRWATDRSCNNHLPDNFIGSFCRRQTGERGLPAGMHRD